MASSAKGKSNPGTANALGRCFLSGAPSQSYCRLSEGADARSRVTGSTRAAG
ncbi:hypothetical protein [Pseudoramibacter alactolyticus]